MNYNKYLFMHLFHQLAYSI